jgi:putative ABC transport system permease protein
MDVARTQQPRLPVGPTKRGLKQIRLGLLVNAIRWRAGSSAVFFLVALLAVAAAAAGPVYLPAADQSVLEHVVLANPPESTGMVVDEQPGQSLSQATFRKDLSALPRSPSGRPFFESPIYIAIAAAQVLLQPQQETHGGEHKPKPGAQAPAGPLAVVDVVSRSGACANLVFTEGRCPGDRTDLAISTRSAAYLHLRLGSPMLLSMGRSTYRCTVSGLFNAGSGTAPYWWGSNYMQFGTKLSPPPRMDDIFVDPSLLSGLPAHFVGLSADVPVNTTGLVSTEITAFRRALSGEELGLGKAGLIAGSGIGTYLDNVSSQQQAMTTIIAVVDLQLLLLVLMVLFGIAGRMAAERRQDLALANLRGLSPRSMWGVALREPFVLMIAATPLGAALGWLIGLATARAELLAGVPVGFDSLAVGAAVAAMLAALVATAAGSRRLLARAVRATPVRSSRVGAALALAGEAFVIALALAAVVQVSAAGIGNRAKSQPLAAFAPGLIALAAGVIAARIVPLGCRALAAATQYSPRVGLSLGLQRVARQSGVIRQAVIVAIAVSLACFATAGFFIDKTNRSDQAAFLVGANRVLTVSVPPTVNFEKAVRQADPSGKAMAVQVLSNPQGTLLAVDATRFAQTAAWLQQPGARTSRAVARFLSPPVAPDVVVQGSDVDITADLRATVTPAPSLVLGLFNEQYGSSVSVTVGPLSSGRHRYVTSLQGYCTSACRLQSITASWAGPQSSGNSATQMTIPVEIEAISQRSGAGASFVPVATGLAHKGWWRVTQSAPDAASSLTASSSGLAVRFAYVLGEAPPSVAPADVPASLPAVVTNIVASVQQSGPTGSTQYSVIDFGGSPLAINGAIQVAAIPSVGTNAVMVDLAGALRNESLPDDTSTKQVWLSAGAGSTSALVVRLRRDGIKVTSVETSASMELAFQKDGPTLAFGLFLLVGAFSSLLATGSMLFAIAAATRQRAIEAVVLRSVGVPRRTLAGAMAAELGIVCATGLVAGTLAGVVAARFSLPSVPEFTGLASGPTLLFNLPIGWLALVVATTAVLLSLASAISIALVAAASTPDKLRISQQ